MPLAVSHMVVEDSRQAFERLLAPEVDRTYQLAGYILGSASDAEDAVHEAILRAWTGFGGLRDRDRFGPWLTRIVVNICRDRLRRRMVVPMVGLGDVEPEAGDPFAEALARDAVGRALDLLGPEQRAVIVLHYFGGRSVSEIGAALGVPSGTVKWRLRAACTRMRRELERNGEVF